jgi:hypothetical protein
MLILGYVLREKGWFTRTAGIHGHAKILKQDENDSYIPFPQATYSSL